jgi:hypothetical protein
VTNVGAGSLSITTNDISTGDITVNGAVTAASLVFNASDDITQTAALTISGTSSFTVQDSSIITLTTASNDFGGAVSLNSGTGNVQLVDTNALVLGTSVLGGLIIVTAGGAITQTGAMSTGTGNSTFESTLSNASILLTDTGNAFTGLVGLTTIGASGDASVTNTLAHQTFNISVGGDLTIVSDGNITQPNGSITVGGTSSFTTTAGSNGLVSLSRTNNAMTGAITLDVDGTGTVNVANTLNLVLAAASTTFGGNFQLTSSLGVVTIPGTLNVTAGTLTITAAGDITQSGVWTTTGNMTFNTTAANGAVTLTQANVFSGNRIDIDTATGGTGDASITNTLDINPVSLDIGGNLVLISDVAIVSSNGFTTVAGTSTFTITSGNGQINMNRALNAMTGTIFLNPNGSGTITLNNTLATDLGAATIGGNLILTSTGALTQSGALDITGTTTLDAGAGNNITLDNTSNDFSTVVITSGNNVTLVDANALDIGTS